MNINRVILGSTGVLSGALMFSSGQVVAQSASAQAMLEEVVVTARRREESLQDLPLSIAAINADAMEAQGILSIEDASDFVPNVTLTTSDRANNTRVVIRGIGGGHPDPVFVFGSGMYIDGHYIPNSLGGYMSTMDIERIELLRGPQGTLFGKNVTGGAVNIITAKPAEEFGSSLTVRTAEHGQMDVRGMLNVPFSDNVFGRFNFANESSDGYYYNHNYNITQGGNDMVSLNAAIRYLPNDNWTLDLSANRINSEGDNKPIQCNPMDGSAPSWGSKGGAREDHLDRKYYTDAEAADGTGYEKDHHAACAADAAAGTFVTSSDKFHFSNLYVDSAFATAQWDSDDGNSMFKANASYRSTDYDYQQDRDGSFYDIDNIGMPVWAKSAGGDIGQDNLTRGFELLFERSINDNIDLTLGYNYFYELARNGDGACRERFRKSGYADVGSVVAGVPQPKAGNTISDGVDCSDVLSGLYFDLLPGQFLPFNNSSRIENESNAFFGHLTWALNDDWTLDLGARHTTDDRNFWNLESGIQGCNIEENLVKGAGFYTHDTDVQYRKLGGPLATNGSAMCKFTWAVTFESALLEGFYNQASDSFDAVTPMASLTRNLEAGDVLESGMIYLLYSEGFLTGGFNTEVNSNLPAIAKYLSYQPEDVANYEIGFKGTFLDGRVQIMADYFFMDYSNKQESISIANPDGLYGVDESLGIVTNVASVDISGIEFELRASPWDGGFISLDVGLLDNKYAAFTYPSPADPAVQIDESDTTIQDLTAEWTVNLGIEHQYTLASGSTLTPRLNMYTQDDIDYRASSIGAAPSQCNQDSYMKVGTRVTYVPPQGNWRASLFGHNITDERIFEACTASRGVYRYRHERPAYWGLDFTMDFGG
ncbi:MAG: TonB-dependent receptor [Candidatus Rariloculaceae bacterium]